MMARIAMLTTLAFALGVDSPSMDLDLWKYAFTQGGLLIVVLVLLWSYRRELKTASEKEAAAQRLVIDRQDEKIRVLFDLVSANTTAMTRAAAASEANEKAAHRLSRALDKFEERH